MESESPPYFFQIHSSNPQHFVNAPSNYQSMPSPFPPTTKPSAPPMDSPQAVFLNHREACPIPLSENDDGISTRITNPHQQDYGGSFVCGGLLATLLISPLLGWIYLLCVSGGPSYYYAKRGIGMGWLVYAICFAISGGIIYSDRNTCHEKEGHVQKVCGVDERHQLSFGLFGIAAVLLLVGVMIIKGANKHLKQMRSTSVNVPSVQKSPHPSENTNTSMPHPIYPPPPVAYSAPEPFQQPLIQQTMHYQSWQPFQAENSRPQS